MGSTCFELSEIRGCVCSPVGEVCNNKTSARCWSWLWGERSPSQHSQQQKGGRARLRSFFFPCWCTHQYMAKNRKKACAHTTILLYCEFAFAATLLLPFRWPQPKLFFGFVSEARLRAYGVIYQHANTKRGESKKRDSWLYTAVVGPNERANFQISLSTLSCSLQSFLLSCLFVASRENHALLQHIYPFTTFYEWIEFCTNTARRPALFQIWTK